jgi:hypothetical protein
MEMSVSTYFFTMHASLDITDLTAPTILAVEYKLSAAFLTSSFLHNFFLLNVCNNKGMFQNLHIHIFF